jgi:hypothetical protein
MIDDEPTITQGIAGDVMSGAPDRNVETMLACELDRFGYIVACGTLNDHGGALVDHGVPDGADFIIARVIRKDHLTGNILLQSIDGALRQWGHCAFSCSVGMPGGSAGECIVGPSRTVIDVQDGYGSCHPIIVIWKDRSGAQRCR